MNDEELEQRLFEELQARIRPPYGAPDTLRRRVGSLEMMEPVRYGAGLGLPRTFRKPRYLAAAAVVAVLIGSLILFRQWSPRPANSVKLPASFEMFGRIDANAAWVEDGADLYVTRDDGATWTKGTVPGGRSMRTASLQTAPDQTTADLSTAAPVATGIVGLGFDHLYPVFVDADHGWLLSWTASNPTSCQTWEWKLTLWRTSDGAQSWQSTQLPGTYKGYGTVHFTDTQHGWVTVNRMDVSICSLQGGSGDGSGPVPTVGPALEPASPAPTATVAPLPEDALTVLSTSDGGVTWSRASTLAALGIVYFTGSDEAWGYGSSDAGTLTLVLHSTDGARTWTTSDLPLPDGYTLLGMGEQPQVSGGTATLRIVAYQSGPTRPNPIVAPGGNYSSPSYVILTFVSSDGGKTWKLDATRAIPGETAHVLDSFRMWSQAPAGQPVAVIENGWVGGEVGGVVSSSTPDSFQASFDGGVSWQSYSIKGLPGTIGFPEWASPDDVWVMLNGTPLSSSAGPTYIYTTRDGGNTWTGLGSAPTWPAPAQPTMTPFITQIQPSFPELVPQSNVMSIGRIDARVGWAAVNGPAGNDLRMTTDGGATWSEPRALPSDGDIILPMPVGMGDIQFVDANHGWLVTPRQDQAPIASDSNTLSPAGLHYGMAVFRTVDGGKSWERSTVDLGEQPFAPQDVQNGAGYGIWTSSVHFRDATHGEAYSTFGWTPSGSASEGGSVCKQASTSDGGATWSAPKDGPCVSQITFNGSSVGYSQSWDGSGTLYVTLDGGQTWVSGELPPSQVGTSGVPGASSVLMVERRSGGGLYALVNSDGSTNLDVSTDGGKTWVQSGAAVGLIGTASYRVAWLGEGNWLALQTDSADPGGSADVRETFDGGLTWLPLAAQGSEPAAIGVAFVSPTDGWVAGNLSVCQNSTDGSTTCQMLGGVVAATSDGGQTWHDILHLP